MQLECDLSIASMYVSAVQRARVISEAWFGNNCYCLACEQESLARCKPNTQATDFSCESCGHRYELKTFEKRPRKSLVDGAYLALMARIESGCAPTLCLLERSSSWQIRALTAIHSSFLVPWVIEQRPPLKADARRAGWIGCNIRLDRIPSDGEVALISNGCLLPKAGVRRRFQRYLPLSNLPKSQRGWATLTLRVLRGLSKAHFTLPEVYAQEREFSAVYPQNRHVREKIRQQLQVLRDLGVIRFHGKGCYELID
ncbi:MAG TPA: DpnI domain-containing protein [Terracidiphilus sp.]|nr:DpnI domain-containing protein [Terracidiphilus sp.]